MSQGFVVRLCRFGGGFGFHPSLALPVKSCRFPQLSLVLTGRAMPVAAVFHDGHLPASEERDRPRCFAIQR